MDSLRSVSYRIAFGVRSDCVRNLIRLRTVSDQIPFGVHQYLFSRCVAVPLTGYLCSCAQALLFVSFSRR